MKVFDLHCDTLSELRYDTSRHTWATLAKYCHFSEQLICDALGHSSTKADTWGNMKCGHKRCFPAG